MNNESTLNCLLVFVRIAIAIKMPPGKNLTFVPKYYITANENMPGLSIKQSICIAQSITSINYYYQLLDLLLQVWRLGQLFTTDDDL